jgi:hypothetical protein
MADADEAKPVLEVEVLEVYDFDRYKFSYCR